MSETINIKLKVWRQKDNNSKGFFESHDLKDISVHMSFLEMMDVLNQGLIKTGKDPVLFDHDCREGICGSCSMVINGDPHGPQKATTTCQLHMRTFKDGDEIFVEPFRAKSFPIIKDLTVDRGAFDRVIEAGGYISISTGNAQDANSIPISKPASDDAFLSATCIGCGACVAACKNASAMLFVSAKLNHLNQLPQGAVEASERVYNMVAQMDKEGFGACTNTGACSASCPKEISLDNISKMNRMYTKSVLKKG
jgi:succinate dehydrogenase / fumarate reductase, iron-sulfur subunit